MGTYVNNNKVALGSQYDLDDAVKEIGDLIGVGARTSGTYAGKRVMADLFVSEGINGLSKNKPVRSSSIGPLTDAQRLDAAYGMTLSNVVIGNFPLDFGKEVSYIYNKPRGIPYSEYFRIRDFNGYHHYAKSPMDFRQSSYNNDSFNGAFYDDNEIDAGWDGEINPNRFFVVKFNSDDGTAIDWNMFERLIGTPSLVYSVHLYNPKYGTDVQLGQWIRGNSIPSEFIATQDMMLNSVLRGDNIRLYVKASTTGGDTYVGISPAKYSSVRFRDGLIYDVTSNFMSNLSIGSPTSGSNSISYWQTNVLNVGPSDYLAFYNLTIRNNSSKTITQSNVVLRMQYTDSAGYTQTSNAVLYRGTSGSTWSIAAGASITDTFIIPYYTLATAFGSGAGAKNVMVSICTEGEDIFNGGGVKYFKVSGEFLIKINRQ